MDVTLPKTRHLQPPYFLLNKLVFFPNVSNKSDVHKFERVDRMEKERGHGKDMLRKVKGPKTWWESE